MKTCAALLQAALGMGSIRNTEVLGYVKYFIYTVEGWRATVLLYLNRDLLLRSEGSVIVPLTEFFKFLGQLYNICRPEYHHTSQAVSAITHRTSR